MCGIFGFIGVAGGPTIKAIREMAASAESRGHHAFGFAWIGADGRLHSYKQAGRVSLHLDIINGMSGARAIIGHTRWATHGRIEDNVNNHPHPCDGGWIVHNGVVTNYAELIREHRLLPQSRCDSEVLGLLIEKLKGSLLHRAVRTTNLVAQDAPLCMAGIWSRPGRVVVVKRGNPLFVGKGSKGNVYFSSCNRGLPGTVKEVEESRAFEFNLTSGEVAQHLVKSVTKGNAKFLGSNWFGDEEKKAPLREPSDEEIARIESGLWDDDVNPADDTAIMDAMRKLEAKEEEEERKRSGLSTQQRAALNLLESRTGDRVPTPRRIDPVSRYHAVRGTLSGGLDTPKLAHFD